MISVNSKHICGVIAHLCCPLAMLRDGGNYFILDFMHYIAHIQILKNLSANSSHGKKRPHIVFFKKNLCMKHEGSHEHAAILYTCTFRVLPLCLHSSDWSHRGEKKKKKTEVVMTTAPFSVTHK